MTTFSLKHIGIRSACAAAALLLVASGFAQNLLLNGSFESEDASVVTQHYGLLGYDPSPGGWSFTASDIRSLSWIESNSDTTAAPDVSGNPIVAQDGEWYVDLGGYGIDAAPSEADYDSLTQSVQTQAGTSYTLSCWEYSLGTTSPGDGDYFNLTWNGQVVPGSQINDAETASGWNKCSFSVVGTGGMDEVGVHGFANSLYVGVDNVSLTAQAVPEPSAFAALGLGLAGLFIKRRK